VVGAGPAIDFELVADAAEIAEARDATKTRIRLLQRLTRHGVAGALRTLQEVDRIGAQPRRSVAIARAPEADRAIGRLAIQQLRDRFLHAAANTRIGVAARFAGERVVIEQRHRYGRQLLGAAIRVAIELIQQRRGIDAG